MKYSPYSVSGLGTFNQCNYKFFLSYVKKLRIESDSYHLHKGSHIHKILENKFDYSVKYPLSEKYNQEEFNETLKIVKNFENSNIGQKYKYLMFNGGVQEEDFAISEYLKLIDFNNKKAFLRGSADLYFVRDKIGYITDWKSGKDHSQNKDFGIKQGKMYAIYLFLKYPEIQKIKTTFVFIEHLTHKTITFERKDFDKYVEDFKEEVSRVENTKFFHMSVSPLCDYCDFKKSGHCKGETGEVTEEPDWF